MFVPVGSGTALDVDVQGNGPTVVLLHGWPVTAMHWRHLVPTLVRAGYRTIAVEPRGLGDRSTGRGDLAKATLAREVVQVLDAMAVSRFAIAGHDMGGTIALMVAAMQPHRVAAVIVEEDLAPGIEVALPEPSEYPDWHLPLFQAPEGVAERLLRGRHDAVVDAFLDGSAGPAKLEFDAQVAYLTAYAGDERLATTLGLHRAKPRDEEDVRRIGRRLIRVPGLAIGGRHGLGPAVAEALAKSLTSVRSVVAPDAGHYPAEQAPDAVAGAVIPFLRAA